MSVTMPHSYQKKFANFLFLGLALLFIFSSCKSLPGLKVQKKRVEAVEASFEASLSRLDESLANQKQLKESLDDRLALLEEKHNNREIDTQTYERLKEEYTNVKNNTDDVISSIEDAKGRVENYRQKAPTKRRDYGDYEVNSKKYLTDSIDGIVTIANEALAKSSDLAFFDDLLNSDLTEEFELSVFFPPGVYTLNEEDLPEAKKAFSPLVNQITGFVSKYPDKTLAIRVMTKGYADGQPVRKTSKLGERLTKISGKENADSKELNRVLSELRAKEISGFILQLISEGNPSLLDENKYKISMEPVGMGETFPNPAITDYTKDDRRRRIVSLFWDVFPMR